MQKNKKPNPKTYIHTQLVVAVSCIPPFFPVFGECRNKTECDTLTVQL